MCVSCFEVDDQRGALGGRVREEGTALGMASTNELDYDQQLSISHHEGQWLLLPAQDFAVSWLTE